MALPTALKIIISVITMIIMLPLSALGLWVSGKIFKIDIKYLRALVPALILVGIGFLISIPQWFSDSIAVALGTSGIGFLVGIALYLALYLTLPKYFFNLEWKQGLLVGLVWFAIMFVVGFIIGLIVGILAFSIGLIIGLSAAAA